MTDSSNDLSSSERAVDGRWIVLIVVGLAVVLGLVGLKFRQPSPMQKNRQTTVPTQPANPATVPDAK